MTSTKTNSTWCWNMRKVDPSCRQTIESPFLRTKLASTFLRSAAAWITSTTIRSDPFHFLFECGVLSYWAGEFIGAPPNQGIPELIEVFYFFYFFSTPWDRRPTANTKGENLSKSWRKSNSTSGRVSFDIYVENCCTVQRWLQNYSRVCRRILTRLWACGYIGPPQGPKAGESAEGRRWTH